MNKIIGEVTYVLRDKITEEIINKTTEKNIFTTSFLGALQQKNLPSLSFRIATTDKNHAPSRFTHGITSHYSSGNPPFNFTPEQVYIPNEGGFQKLSSYSEIEDLYMEYNCRVSAPAVGTTKTIKTIILLTQNRINIGNFSSSSVLNRYNGESQQGYSNTTTIGYSYSYVYEVVAYLSLYTPVVQTDSQILDIYYRLYLPYNNSPDNLMGKRDYYEFLKGSLYNPFSGWSYFGSSNPFKQPSKLKGSDVGKCTLLTSITSALKDGSSVAGMSTSFTPVPGAIGFTPQPCYPVINNVNYTHDTFTRHNGNLIGSTQTFTRVPQANRFIDGNWSYLDYCCINNVNFEFNSSKIGNVFGLAGLNSTTPLIENPLSVDNLATGTGVFIAEGVWNNTTTPNSPELYYSTKLPEKVFVKITDSGNVGVSKYKVIREKYFGNHTPGYPKNKSGDTLASNFYYGNVPVLPLSGLGNSFNGNLTTSSLSLIEEIDNEYLSTVQISASCRYDDGSIIFVKSNKIILYNIAGGDYWKFEAGYTNIHQVAVVSDKIYIACKNTGLWVVDPKTSLSVTSLNTPVAGIDLSKCYGVAEGYNNTLWAVGVNCLASFDGVSWTKYDSTTVPAITMAGVTDNNWNNVEYLKVDKDSPTNQMMLVRSINATVDSQILGIWWSTDGVTSNTVTEEKPASNYIGIPRLHRQHVQGLSGAWWYLSNGYYTRTQFGTNTATQLSRLSNSDTSGNSLSRYSALVIVKDTDGSPLLFRTTITPEYIGVQSVNNWSISDNNYNFYTRSQQFINTTGTAVYTLNNTAAAGGSGWVGKLNTDSYLPGYTGNPDSWYRIKDTITNYTNGSGHSHTTFLLCPGVIVNISKGSANTSNAFTFVHTTLTTIGLNNTQEGGPAKGIIRQEYGWNGSAWELNYPDGKPTHLSSEELFDGVFCKFEEGIGGTSFVSPNHYQFILHDGLAKDNATKAKFNYPYYNFTPVQKSLTDLDMTTVPTSRFGTTGAVGLDIYQMSQDITIDSTTGYISFPGVNEGQYAVGNKSLIGDFVVSYDCTHINGPNTQNKGIFFGISRSVYAPGLNNKPGSAHLGLAFYRTGNGYVIINTDDIDYWYSGSYPYYVHTSTSTISSIEIKRISGVISFWVNGTLVNTLSYWSTSPRGGFDSPYQKLSRISDAHQVLDLIWSTAGQNFYTTTLTENMLAPSANITSNGSACFVYMGDPITRTGRYNSNYTSIMPNSTTVLLDGVSITPKVDGSMPAQGEIAMDPYSGILYFNPADAGKSISATYDILTI